MARTDDLAADLGLDEGDVRVLLRQLGDETPEPPDEVLSFVRELLDQDGARSVPGLFLPTDPDAPRRSYGLGSPHDPTAL